MICIKCSAEIPDGSAYCNLCGRKQARDKRSTAKRPNGLGSVYYDPRSKKWIAQVVTGRRYTEDRKVRFEYARKSFSSKTEALKQISVLEDEAQKKPAFTVSYYYSAFTEGRGAKLSANKLTAYKIAYNRLKDIHGKAVEDLTINELQGIVNSTYTTYYPVRDIRALLNAIFKLAHADNQKINPVLPHLLELPSMEEDSPDPFTEEEQIKLWVSYESGNIGASLPLNLIYTGMMTGEARKLTKQMVHLEDKEIVGVGLKTKTRKEKTVLLPDDIIPVLEDVVVRSETDRLYPMSEDNFYSMYYQALKDAGITRHLTPYSCRHTTATVLAVHENVAPQVLQRIMRWKSTKMMDKYVNPSEEDARKAVNRI